MHDELIERRLRAALSEEAGSMAFTITPAELERRLVLHRRTVSGRRLTLLLAAAVGISIFGVGGALSGLFSPTLPSPTGPVDHAPNAPGPTEAAVTELMGLDELTAADPGSVVLAQAHGPTGAFGGIPETELQYPLLSLGTLQTAGTYTLTGACLDGTSLDFSFPSLTTGVIPRAAIRCDGRLHDAAVELSQPADVNLTTQAGTAWRFALRGAGAGAAASQVEPIPPSPTDQEELVRWDPAAVDPKAEPWRQSGLLVQQVGALPPREGYYLRLTCAAGPQVRYILGDVMSGTIVPSTETLFACDPARILDAAFLMAQPAGSQVFLAAAADQQVSLLVTSPAPPIDLTRREPGWQLSGGFGPDLAFDEHPVSFSGAGTGEDHVQVVLACTGTQPIEVVVEDGTPIGAHQQRFTATCTPEGSTTSQIFKVTEAGVAARYVAPSGVWTALSILVPSN